ncbi:MAG: 50S ribosomal protein L9 [Actinomycetota bacterium]
MKVILKQSYENLGNVGEIVEVKDGYAKNYLIPNDIAVVATKGNIKQMELVKKSLLKIEAKNVEEAEKVVEALKDLKLVFKVKTSEEGKLYGSITNKDIAERIARERNVEIDRKKIELGEHIKELGEYDIEIQLYKDIKSNVKIILESENQEEIKPKEEATEKEKAEEAEGKKETVEE